MGNGRPNQSVAVGGVIYTEKLVTAMEKRKESRYNLRLPTRLITAFIVCVIDRDSSFEECLKNWNALTNSRFYNRVEFYWIGMHLV